VKEPVLIDTSSWIEALRFDGDEGVRSRVAAALGEGRARLVHIVLLELWNGARGAREQRELAHVAEAVPVLPATDEVWAEAVRLAVSCRRAGVTAPATDLLVYACAQVHGVNLEYSDRHFDDIRGVGGGLGAG